MIIPKVEVICDHEHDGTTHQVRKISGGWYYFMSDGHSSVNLRFNTLPEAMAYYHKEGGINHGCN